MRDKLINSSVAALLLTGLLLVCAKGFGQRQQVTSDENQAKQLAIGKGIFVEHCAKCHDERGNKTLPDGPPLSERKLSEEQITRSVAGRLKALPDDQKRAVVLYIQSFLKKS
jgi:mono/diheme cytochrome c family protein